MTENDYVTFSQALDRTLTECGINAKWLSERSGVSQQLISGFRNGRQRVYSDSLERILTALPIEARQHFMALLAGPTLEASINHMSSEDLARLLIAIGDRLKQKKLSSHLISA
jgi:transcriptional regulator with XRE-family HTH domain